MSSKFKIPKSVTQVIEDLLRDMIINDELHFGQQISEEALSKKFNVSKTPIREAMLKLSLQEGLIVIKPRSGSFVFTIDAKDIDELEKIRVLLENYAIRCSAEVNHAEMIAEMTKNINAQLKMNKENDYRNYRKLDVLFHRIFFDFCNNEVLKNTYKTVDSKFFAMRSRINFTNEYINRSIDYHCEIFEALKKHEIDNACRINKEHINVSFTERAKYLLQMYNE
ncbi:GntR family transcriptional regulator [Gilliamella apis]|uniref:GntR family transcriptional regulator n=1 Tax=Gilliamella apis TaxID=1970738 RepID=UPI00080DE96D|nr:GntR family transcriptional regulator [Gilliamella apis]OCG04813.1 hypothetical protein A9G19_03290 [Gilliamella apis]